MIERDGGGDGVRGVGDADGGTSVGNDASDVLSSAAPSESTPASTSGSSGSTS